MDDNAEFMTKIHALREHYDHADASVELTAAIEHVMNRYGDVFLGLAPYDHTFQVTAWRDGVWWFLEIERPSWCEPNKWWGSTQTPWLSLAEYMAKDLLVCVLDLDYKYWDQITVNITRGIGPVEDGGWSLRSWLWAQWSGLVDMYRRWRVEREAKRARAANI